MKRLKALGFRLLDLLNINNVYAGNEISVSRLLKQFFCQLEILPNDITIPTD